MRHSFFTRLAVIPTLVLTAASCEKLSTAKVKTDSLTVALSEQTILGNQLQFQKDSLTRVVLDADAFIGRMDSAMKTVRGLPASNREANEGAMADQMAARRDVMRRVNALVARTKNTAKQLADLSKKDSALTSENVELRAAAEAQVAKANADAQMVADLGATLERQRVQITELESRIDSLGIQVATLDTANHKAYYIVGTERELIAKGVIVKEGGAKILFGSGKTIVPARAGFDHAIFTPIDQRSTPVITVPDSTKRYRIISRQPLIDADVAARKGTSFQGNLNISNPAEFWATSRYLILVQL